MQPFDAIVKAFRMTFGAGRAGAHGRAWGPVASVPFLTTTTGWSDAAAASVDPSASAIVQATVLWLARAFPEAPLRVQRRARDGSLTPVPGHPLTALVAAPNPYYSGVLLWQATIADWVLSGNAYWAKVRRGTGLVTELWWLPAGTVRPYRAPDSTALVDYYEYTPQGGRDPQRLAPDEVVHFRYGMDPADPACGLSPLGALLREVLVDEEAQRFTAAILRNLGVPGVVISPEQPVSVEEARTVKDAFRASFGGAQRGDVLVMQAKTAVSVLSFSPQQMNLEALRRLPEERVTAVLGIPAVVVGLGAGLDRSTFANFEEARAAAYESNVIPSQRLFASELGTQLLPDFGAADNQVVDFDLGQVRVLQPDLDKLWTRLDVGVRGGWVFPNEARAQVGLPPLPEGDVLYVPTSLTPTDPQELLAPPEPPPTPLRALPAPEEASWHAPETKAAHDAYARGALRIQGRTAQALERSVARQLNLQRAALQRAISAQQKALGWEDVFDAVAAAAGMLRAVERAYRSVLDQIVPLTEATLGVQAQPDPPSVADLLADAAVRVAGITETTRLAIVDALRESVALGEGVEQTAKRLDDLAAFGRPRARTIARTEVGHATNAAGLASFRASGVVTGVLILDGDDCGLHSHDGLPKANGMRIPLEEMAGVPTLAHPRCVRAFAPLTAVDEIGLSA